MADVLEKEQRGVRTVMCYPVRHKKTLVHCV